MALTKKVPGTGPRTAQRSSGPRRPSRGPARRPEPPPDLRNSFTALKGLLVKHARHLMVVTDAPDEYTLDTRKRGAHGEPVLFGSVVLRGGHLSYQLMPLQMDAALMAVLSPALRRHLQGKRGFSFTALDASMMEELDLLTRAGMASFVRKGLA